MSFRSKYAIPALLFALCFSFHLSNAQSYPRVLWGYNTLDFSAGQAAAKDFDGDGKYEITFGCYRNDSSIYALNAENGSLLWKYNASAAGSHGCNDVAPVIYDVDNDGTQEVIVPGSCNPKTFCFNGADGSLKWSCDTRGSDSPPTIADIDNDGKPEILHGEFGGWVICINAEDGSVKWEIKVDGNSWIQTAPTIVDLDNDGILDFVVASWNFDYKDSIFAFRGDNQARLWAYPVHDHIYHGTAVSDLHNDGKPELVLGSYNDTLYCLNGENGTIKWKYAASGAVTGPASIGDIDNDGSCEVVFGAGYRVTALSNTGVLKWQYAIPNWGYTFRGAALADINDDSYPDVLFGTYNTGVLYALNGNNGSLIWDIDLNAHHGNPQFGLNHAPLVADFDNDDTLDVFVVGGYGVYPPSPANFGRAYMIQAGKGKGPDWLMFQRDIRRQSSLCMNPATSINETEAPSDVRIYPNPSSGKITIELNNALEISSLEIFDMHGKLLMQISTEGQNDLTIDMSACREGLYYFHVRSNSGVQEQGRFLIIH